MDPGMIRHLALGALVPGFASLILFALIWWRRPSPLTHSGLGWLLESAALAIAVIAGLYAVLNGFTAAPIASDQRLPYVAVVAALGAALVGASRAHRDGRAGIIPFLLVLLAATFIGTFAGSAANWPLWKYASLLAGACVFGTAIFLAFSHTFAKASPRLGLVAATLVAGSAGQVLVLALASLKLGQSAGVVSAALGGAAAVAFVRVSPGLRGAGAALASIMLTVILAQGALFGEPDLLEGIAYACSIPVAAVLVALCQSPAASRLPAGARWMITLFAAIFPAALAVFIALQRADSGDEYDYEATSSITNLDHGIRIAPAGSTGI